MYIRNVIHVSHQTIGDLASLFRVSQYLGHQLAENIGGVLVAHRHCTNSLQLTLHGCEDPGGRSPTVGRGVLDRVLPNWAASPGQSQTGRSLICTFPKQHPQPLQLI